jgi:two-component sensor histidine kinase
VRRQLKERGLIDTADPAISDKADAALLVVSELVTNACRHAGGPGEMRTKWRNLALTVEVDDTTTATPEIRPPEQRGQGGGYGMGLVDNLADDWGVRPRQGTGRGKTVFARIVFPPAD